MLSVVFSLVLQAVAGQSPISGVVHDSAGAVVAGATVIVQTANGAAAQTVSSSDGRFSIAAPSPGDSILVVRAAGFAEWRRDLAGARAAGATEDEVREAISFAIRANAARAHADILKVYTDRDA